MSRFLYIALILLTLLPVPGTAASSPATKEKKRVLVLYSLDKGHPAHGLTEQGISEVFRANRPFDVQLYSEYLDMGRFPDPAQAKAMAVFLQDKYAGIKFDAIIAVYPSAVDFLLKYQKTLFPGVPIVAAEVSRGYADNLEGSPARGRITGTIMGDNISGLLDAALRMKPATKQVALVAGVSPLDTYNEQIFRAGLKPYASRIELIDLTKLSMSETNARVGALPRDTIVLYASIIKDGAGQLFTPRESLSLINRVTNVPIFSLYDTFLGHGIVGGRLVSFELQGKNVAGLTLRVLAGESPAAIPFGGGEAYVDLYDWRELRRWKIPETAVPPGSVIRYRQLSLWEEHRWTILGTVAIIVSEAALIIGLAVNLRRRRKAEQSLSESEMRLKLAVDSAGAGLWSFDVKTGWIWATDRALELYGFAPEDAVDFDKFLTVVHEEDRDWLVQAIEKAIRDNKEFNVEYRIVLPDGNYRWMAARGCPQQNARGETFCLIGAAVDISGRKAMEESLLDSEKNLRSLMGRLISAQEEERSHIARELHDDVTQRLAVLAIEAGALELQRNPDQQVYREKLHAIKESLVKLSEDIHSLSRQLHPSILDDLGLLRALEAETARFSKKEGIKVLFNHEDLPPAIPRDIALALYRVIQEGLRNIARHSTAASAHVDLKGLPDAIHLTIADTGCGFDSRLMRQRPGLGLASMKERVELVNGAITVDSFPGEGTLIDVRVPCRGELS